MFVIAEENGVQRSKIRAWIRAPRLRFSGEFFAPVLIFLTTLPRNFTAARCFFSGVFLALANLCKVPRARAETHTAAKTGQYKKKGEMKTNFYVCYRFWLLFEVRTGLYVVYCRKGGIEYYLLCCTFWSSWSRNLRRGRARTMNHAIDDV